MARRVTKSNGSAERKKNTRAISEKQKKLSYEITSIVTMTIGIFMGVSFFTSAAGSLGEWIKSFSFWFLGNFTSYLIPFAIIGVGIVFISKKQISSRGYKLLFGFLLFWIISTTCEFYGIGGGVLGGLIAEPIYKTLGSLGGGLVLFSLVLVLGVVVFEISVTGFFAWLGSGCKYGFELLYSAFEDNTELEGKEKKSGKRKADPKEKYQKEIEEIEQDIKNYEKEYKRIDFDVSDIPEKPEQMPLTMEPMAVQESSALEEMERETASETAQPAPSSVVYKLPPISLLKKPKERNAKADAKALEETAKKLIDTLASFGVEVKIVDYSMGPTVTRYELQPGPGVKISKIANLSDDIALNLAAMGVRIEAPIPGKAAIGIEVPNKNASPVHIREVIGHRDFANFPSKLAFALGKDIAGQPIIADIARMPHLLIAGSTGAGKSVCINSLITSLLYKALPNEVKLILIDPKMVELGGYNGIPHLLIPVVTNPQKAAGALQWAVKEMTDRYKAFADKGVRDLKSYNELVSQEGLEQMPQIVIIIDELADLMMVAPNDVEDSICRLAQMARAAGMHLVIATQRPSVDVITGIIKANIPSRISFAVSSQIDSRTILDTTGAEKLLGRGDMLYSPIGSNKPVRLQGPFVSDEEVEQVVAFVKSQVAEQEYDQDIVEVVENFEIGGNSSHEPESAGNADELLPQAIEMAIECGQASVAMYQRRLKVGYQRAARLIDQMEERGIIGKFDGTKPRQVLITRAQFNEMFMNEDHATEHGA